MRMKKPILIWGAAGLLIFVIVATIIFTIGPPETTTTSLSTSYNGVEIVPDLRKDSIPALTNPELVSASSDISWLNDSDLVIGVMINGDVRAYPVKIMSWHEIVNETIGGKDVVVTYCPLCSSAVVFSRDIDGQTLDFGNTGALYESCAVMYDTQSNSYWWQVNGQSIRGPQFEKTMAIEPSILTTWANWTDLNPGTRVMSVNTGYSRDYLTDPYNDYYKLENSAFPVSVDDNRLAAKDLVIGIEVNGKHKAYSVDSAKGTVIKDEFEGQEVEIIGTRDGKTAQAVFIRGNQRSTAPQTNAFWFAWSAAHPETELYQK